MREIVINTCYGGFGLSEQAIRLLKQAKNIGEDAEYDIYAIKRDDPDLIAVVKELRGAANGYASNLKIIEIPLDVEWELCEYDGSEWVAEKHRSWS